MDQLYVCQVCGHVEFGQAPDQCPVCYAPKEKFENKNDVIHPAEQEGKEKHVPVILVSNECGMMPDACQDVNIKVGATPHPMEPDHSIQWIDTYFNKQYISRIDLKPSSLQAAVGLHFKKDQTGTVTVIEFCNKHGHWMAEANLA